MKKSNFFTLLTLCVMIIAVMIFASCSNSNKTDNEPNESSSISSITGTAIPSTESETFSTEESNYPEPPPSTEKIDESNIETATMKDALFIGDSRTVGIMEYAGLNDADFFCSVGMSVFNVRKSRVSVPTVGKVTLNELLTNKKYGKIYLMLGINELGYSFQSIINKYGELIEFIESNQKDSDIFIQANLHVSKERHESDKYINNTAINKLNSELSKFADNENIFYLDANCLFDDEYGNLSADKTSDNAHLYAKHYAEWGEWICKETAKYVKEG